MTDIPTYMPLDLRLAGLYDAADEAQHKADVAWNNLIGTALYACTLTLPEDATALVLSKTFSDSLGTSWTLTGYERADASLEEIDHADYLFGLSDRVVGVFACDQEPYSFDKDAAAGGYTDDEVAYITRESIKAWYAERWPEEEI